MSHVTHINESCHTYKWVVSHLQFNRVTHMNELFHICIINVSRVYALCSTHEWDIVLRPRETCVSDREIIMMISLGRKTMSLRDTHTHTHTRTHTHTCLYVCMRYAAHMQRIWIGNVTHMSESCHTYEWVMSHVWMSRVSRAYAPCHTYEWVMSLVWMSHVSRMRHGTHMSDSCHACEWFMTLVWMRHVSRVYVLTYTHTHMLMRNFTWNNDS